MVPSFFTQLDFVDSIVVLCIVSMQSKRVKIEDTVKNCMSESLILLPIP